MLRNQQQGTRQSIKLPKQDNVPNLKQIQVLQNHAQTNSGQNVELPFGDPPEDCILTVCRDKSKGDFLWMLYRGSGANSFLVWDYVTADTGTIHNLIAAQFPGVSQKRMVLAESAPEVVASQQITSQLPPSASYDMQASTGAQRVSQSNTGGVSELSQLKRATLEGELENLSIPNVLQSIGMGKMTGRLEIVTAAEIANVFFGDGAPLHCEMRGSSGDQAIIELMGWTKGAFRFYPEPRIGVVTVKRRLDGLMMEGAAFDDQQRFLADHGMRLEAFVMRKHANLSESQFEQMVAKGASGDLRTLKAVYQAVDNLSTVVEVLRRRPLPKTEWVPVVYTLVGCDLISFVERLPDKAKMEQEGVPQVDWNAVRSFEKTLLRPDTQLFTYPAFLYFMEKEFARFERFAQPFSIILLDIGVRSSQNFQLVDALPLKGVKEVARRIDRLKRKTDVLGHYETFGLGLLLPWTDGTSARSFAARLSDVIMSSPLDPEIDSSAIVIKIGTGCIPEACQDLNVLLYSARPSKA